MIQQPRDIRAEVMKDPRAAQKNSWEWYQRTVRTPSLGMSPQRFMGDNVAHQTQKIVPGSMVLFFYDPKFKKDLPYYDTFPLNLVFNATSTHFTSLNLHYMAPRYRMVLLDSLLKIKENKKIVDKDKIVLSWQLINRASKMKQIQHCVKQYLFGHVKSQFLVVPMSEWEYVIWLPVERFKKATAEQVWKESMT